MEAIGHGSLDLVPIDSIHPHELADSSRKDRIQARLEADGILRDPLMVGTVPHFEGYILLDGTNRLEALTSLGLAYGLVQTIDYSVTHGTTLRTWGHSTHVPFEELVEGASGIPGAAVHPVAELGAAEALAKPATLAVVLGGDRVVAVERVSDYPYSRPEQLRALVDLYETRMTRVDCDASNVEEVAQTVCAPSEGGGTLVAFPPITRSQVAAMSMRGLLIPAGITRHVILDGRALRVNVPLDMLADSRPLHEAREALRRHLASLHPRLYREPTILYDS